MLYTTTLIAGYGKNQVIFMPDHHGRVLYELVANENISLYDIAYHFNFAVAGGIDISSNIKEQILLTIRKIIDSDSDTGRKMALVEKITSAGEMVFCTGKIGADLGDEGIMSGADALISLSPPEIADLVLSPNLVFNTEHGRIEFPPALCGSSRERIAARLVVCMDSILKVIYKNLPPPTEIQEISPEMFEEMERLIMEHTGKTLEELEQEFEQEQKKMYEEKSFDEIEKSSAPRSFDGVGACREFKPFRAVNEIVFRRLKNHTGKRGTVEDLLGADSIDEVLKIMDNMDLAVERVEDKGDEDTGNG